MSLQLEEVGRLYQLIDAKLHSHQQFQDCVAMMCTSRVQCRGSSMMSYLVIVAVLATIQAAAICCWRPWRRARAFFSMAALAPTHSTCGRTIIPQLCSLHRAILLTVPTAEGAQHTQESVGLPSRETAVA